MPCLLGIALHRITNTHQGMASSNASTTLQVAQGGLQANIIIAVGKVGAVIAAFCMNRCDVFSLLSFPFHQFRPVSL
jgi:hypothetical protein